MAQEPKLTALGKFVVLMFIASCFYAAYVFMTRDRGPSNVTPPGTGVSANPKAAESTDSTGPVVSIGIAYGTEKKQWLELEAAKFAETAPGKKIKVELIPMGSLEAAHAVIGGDKRIHVWSPASSLYKGVFVQDWQSKYAGNPIVKEELLALTPMVFIMWEPRYQAFIQKYKTMNFKTIGEALNEKTGWKGIAQKPEWGFFKFGHTHPNESNSGLAALVLMTNDFHNKTTALKPEDLVDETYQKWILDIEKAVTGLPSSTGYMMRDMVLKGPSAYDAILVYEQVAIEQLKNAEGRWSELHLVYPDKNIWCDHPYYILNASWSSPEQRKAAQVFLDYLMSEPVQTDALGFGFRPGNTNVPIRTPESPFTKYGKYGLQIELTTMCEPPNAEAINNLLSLWQRNHTTR